jgi:hypothetical protein
LNFKKFNKKINIIKRNSTKQLKLYTTTYKGNAIVIIYPSTWKRIVFRFSVKNIISSLKTESKFDHLEEKDFTPLQNLVTVNRLYFKNTGSNFFITVTNNLGEVYLTYSIGMFKSVSSRKEKLSYALCQRLGQIASIKLSKVSRSTYIAILPMLLRKNSGPLHSILYGITVLRDFICIKIYVRASVIRNGVRARKLRRK